MAVHLNQCIECTICRVPVPRHQYDDHYDGHFKKRKRISTPTVAAGEVLATVADPNVKSDLRTVVLE